MMIPAYIINRQKRIVEEPVELVADAVPLDLAPAVSPKDSDPILDYFDSIGL
jgi:hypothetical protein